MHSLLALAFFLLSLFQVGSLAEEFAAMPKSKGRASKRAKTAKGAVDISPAGLAPLPGKISEVSHALLSPAQVNTPRGFVFLLLYEITCSFTSLCSLFSKTINAPLLLPFPRHLHHLGTVFSI